MVVYAIFLCLQGAACQLLEPPRIDAMGNLHRTPVYRSLRACQRAIHEDLGVVVVPEPTDGRYMIEQGMWYECRHRHVDTWQSN